MKIKEGDVKDVSVLNRVVREGLWEEVTLVLSPVEDRGAT